MAITLRRALVCGGRTWAVWHLAAWLGTVAFADVHYAGGPWPGGDAPYTTRESAAYRISDAMGAAETGDTVLCLPRLYCEKVVIKEGVSLVGMGPEDSVIVGKRDIGGDINMGADTVLSGFRVVDSLLFAWDWGPVLLAACVFDGSQVTAQGNITVRACRFEGLWATWRRNYLLVSAGRLVVSDCAFRGGGRAAVQGIGVLDGVRLEATRSLFVGLETAIHLSDAYADIRDCLFVDNELGIDTGLLHVSVDNCTLYGNGWAITTGTNEYPHAFTNCIIWASQRRNVLEKTKGYPLGVYLPVITFSDVEGGYPGRGNLDADPMFFLPSGDQPDLHLCAFSPCIDAGDPFSDYSNEPEPNGGRVNMGAYGNTWEATTSELVDTDADNLRDDWEMEHFATLDGDGSGDADYDGLVDREEYRHLSDPNNPDSDGDGLLDGEEVMDFNTDPILPDTDNDGTPDGKEVAEGTDPLDPWDAFSIVKFWIENNQMHVVHPVQPGYWYCLEYSYRPKPHDWGWLASWRSPQGITSHTFVLECPPHLFSWYKGFFRVSAKPYP